jgi:pyruvate/2-oxoglutarate dehydrogenase complex dihydrolipoamide acyltransferase (E2) component
MFDPRARVRFLRAATMTSSETPTHTIAPKNRFFEALRSMAEYEIRPGNTVSFISEVDLTEVERVRGGAGTLKPSYTAFVVKAVALALRDFPYANRRVCRRAWLPFLRPRLQQFHRCDVAVASERDVPGTESAAFFDIVRDADQLSMAAINDQLQALATCDVATNKQWREFSTVITRLPQWLSTLLLRLPWFFPGLWVKWRGGAVLISSPAKYGVDLVVASWSHPLGISFGLVKPRPVVSDGAVVVRPTFSLLLNFDRNVMAGAPAARFFKRIIELLEHAEGEMAALL